MPIATGLEREELEFELEGKQRFDLDPPSGPFGTKEAPAIVESYFDKRIVGCPGDLMNVQSAVNISSLRQSVQEDLQVATITKNSGETVVIDCMAW